MNPRIWRAGALVGSVALIVLTSTQGAAGQPPTSASGSVPLITESVLMTAGTFPSKASLPAIPESGSLLLLGSAFALAARQLRRIV
jgi:hypothetical protein